MAQQSPVILPTPHAVEMAHGLTLRIMDSKVWGAPHHIPMGPCTRGLRLPPVDHPFGPVLPLTSLGAELGGADASLPGVTASWALGVLPGATWELGHQQSRPLEWGQGAWGQGRERVCVGVNSCCHVTRFYFLESRADLCWTHAPARLCLLQMC